MWLSQTNMLLDIYIEFYNYNYIMSLFFKKKKKGLFYHLEEQMLW